jgi:hypothetical protein
LETAIKTAHLAKRRRFYNTAVLTDAMVFWVIETHGALMIEIIQVAPLFSA